jgi:hypothetical protein
MPVAATATGGLAGGPIGSCLVHAVGVVAAGDALLATSVTRRLIAQFASHGRAAHEFP